MTVIQSFVDRHHELKEQEFERGLYVRIDTEEYFILECPEWKNQKKTFVFVYSCGHFCECHTEYNTFEKHLFSMVCNCDFMELKAY